MIACVCLIDGACLFLSCSLTANAFCALLAPLEITISRFLLLAYVCSMYVGNQSSFDAILQQFVATLRLCYCGQ